MEKNRICFETAQTTKYWLIKTGFTFIKKGFSKNKFFSCAKKTKEKKSFSSNRNKLNKTNVSWLKPPLPAWPRHFFWGIPVETSQRIIVLSTPQDTTWLLSQVLLVSSTSSPCPRYDFNNAWKIQWAFNFMTYLSS